MKAKKIETLDGKTREYVKKAAEEVSILSKVDIKKAGKIVVSLIRYPFDYLRKLNEEQPLNVFLIDLSEAYLSAIALNRLKNWIMGKISFRQAITTPPSRASLVGALVQAVPVDAGRVTSQPYWRWLIDYVRKHPSFRKLSQIENALNSQNSKRSYPSILPAVAMLGTTYALLARHRYINEHYVQTGSNFHPFYLAPIGPQKWQAQNNNLLN